MAVTLEEAKPSVAGFISDRLDRIDRLIQGCVDRQEIPGAVAMLLKDGQIGYYRAFGWADLDTKKPMEKDALFRVASMSKLITTVATLQIYEKGHYDMGTPLADVLPEFAEPEVFVSWDEEKQVFVTEPAKQKIRMKHLFTHTSGIVYPVFTNAGRDGYLKAGITDACPDGTMDLAENIQRLAGVPLAHEPGEGYTYGMNMDVLGRVSEVVDGRPFARYMREEIFQPLGMTDTGFLCRKKRENGLYPFILPWMGNWLALMKRSLLSVYPTTIWSGGRRIQIKLRLGEPVLFQPLTTMLNFSRCWSIKEI